MNCITCQRNCLLLLIYNLLNISVFDHTYGKHSNLCVHGFTNVKGVSCTLHYALQHPLTDIEFMVMHCLS